MNADDLRKQIEDLKLWKQKGVRAPHKPLLVLWALSQCISGEDRMIPYAKVKKDFGAVLRKYGPPETARDPSSPKYPFRHLRYDGDGQIWELSEDLPRKPTDGILLEKNVLGGFREDVYALLRDDPVLAEELKRKLLQAHFPTSYHEDIIQDIGLPSEPDLFDTEDVKTRRQRNPNFSRRVSIAYSYECAICGLAPRLGERPIALEAAHIQWHCADGPDQVDNGLCLCSLHHKLFDRGAFTLSFENTHERKIRVSPALNGPGAKEVLGRYEDKVITAPQKEDDLPHPEFLQWHQTEVFDNSV